MLCQYLKKKHCAWSTNSVVAKKSIKELAGFFVDDGHSFDQVLFYGHESMLIIFEVLLFGVIDLMAESYVLSAILLYIIMEVWHFNQNRIDHSIEKMQKWNKITNSRNVSWGSFCVGTHYPVYMANGVFTVPWKEITKWQVKNVQFSIFGYAKRSVNDIWNPMAQ